MSDASTTFFTDEIAPRCLQAVLGLIVPRPIGWIGSLSAGRRELAPYSFFNLIGNDPMHVPSPGSVGGGDKDSLANVKQVPEFTVNIVTAETVAAMNDTAATLPPEEDEFEHAGLTKLASERIRPPALRRRPPRWVIVVDIVHVGRAGGGNDLVIGEVVVVHVPIESSTALASTSPSCGRLAATPATGTPTPPTCSTSPDRPDGDQHEDLAGSTVAVGVATAGNGRPSRRCRLCRTHVRGRSCCGRRYRQRLDRLDGRPRAGHAGPVDAHRRRAEWPMPSVLPMPGVTYQVGIPNRRSSIGRSRPSSTDRRRGADRRR